MNFLEEYSRAVRNAREYVLNTDFKEIDISHLFLYHEFPSGEVYKLLTIKKTGRFISLTSDYVDTYLEWIGSYESCVIADEIKKQLENEADS